MNNKDRFIRERFISSAYISKKSVCPDSNDLAAYLEGRASKKQIRNIEEHLTFCPVCLNSLIELQSILREKLVIPPDYIKMKAKNLVPSEDYRKRGFIVRLPERITGLYPFVRKAIAVASIAAIITGVCFLGVKFGHDTLNNHLEISEAFVLE
ncbi:hypothetical protein K8R42_03260, partial [bacterium]|nr:hypothetical protein [bacterium]